MKGFFFSCCNRLKQKCFRSNPSVSFLYSIVQITRNKSFLQVTFGDTVMSSSPRIVAYNLNDKMYLLVFSSAVPKLFFVRGTLCIIKCSAENNILIFIVIGGSLELILQTTSVLRSRLWKSTI